MGKNWYKIGFVFALVFVMFNVLHPNVDTIQAKNGEDDVCQTPVGVLGDDDENNVDCDTIAPNVVSLSRSGTEGSTVGVCGPETITITLSEPSEDFVAADVAASFGFLSNWIAVSPTVYTAVFTPPANSTGSATITIAAGSFTDEAGNLNTAFSSDAIAFDTISPTVAITRSGVGFLDEGQTSTITFTLSEPSTDFTSGDVAVSAGALTGWIPTSSTVYTATFTPPADSNGISTISIAVGSFTDSCNVSKQNVNTGEQFDFMAIGYDTRVVPVPPTTVPVPPTTVPVPPTTVPVPPTISAPVLAVAPTTTTPGIVLPTRGAAPAKNQVAARVYFGLRSAVLTPEAKRTLKSAVQKLPKNQKFVVVVDGMVQFSNNTSNIEPLAAGRAEAVRNYLLTLGIKGTYEVNTRGIVGKTSVARRAMATISYS
jgi:outer membrane protein OmpA-like peptidoglycan-associated protein